MWRMLLSVLGHSSELSIANHSSWSTVSQLKCVSETISNWFENHQPQKTKISTVTYAPFIQNLKQMASRLTSTTSFPRVFFFNFCNFQGNIKAFRLTGLLWRQKMTCFFQHFLQDFKFRSSILLHCKFSFHKAQRWSQVWLRRDFPRPITF